MYMYCIHVRIMFGYRGKPHLNNKQQKLQGKAHPRPNFALLRHAIPEVVEDVGNQLFLAL